MHGSFVVLRTAECRCGEKFTTISRNKKLCDACILRRDLGEPKKITEVSASA